MKYVYDMHKVMATQNLILIYNGEFNQEITKSVLAMAEKNLESIGEDNGIRKKVFNVMVECLQNICKHSDTFEKVEEKHAVFMIGKEDEGYIITSVNLIHTENVEKLKEKLDHINTLDKDGLKSFYKELLKTAQLSEKGGAGLGFVDIARKSGQRLEYDFKPVDDIYNFFCFKTTITKTVEVQ